MRVWQLALFLVVIAGLLAASAPFGDWTQELADARELASECLHRDFLRLPAPASWLGMAPSTALREKAREGLDDPNITGLQAYGLAWLAAPREGIFDDLDWYRYPNANPLRQEELEQLARRFPDCPELAGAWLAYELNELPIDMSTEWTQEARSLLSKARQLRGHFPEDVPLALEEAYLLLSRPSSDEALSSLHQVFALPPPRTRPYDLALAVRAAVPLLKPEPDARWVGTLLLVDECQVQALVFASLVFTEVQRKLYKQGCRKEAFQLMVLHLSWLRSLQPSPALPELSSDIAWLEAMASKTSRLAGELGEKALQAQLEAFAEALELHRSALADRPAADCPLGSVLTARSNRAKWLTGLIAALLTAVLCAVSALALGQSKPPIGRRRRPLLWLSWWQLHLSFLAVVTLSLWAPRLPARHDSLAVLAPLYLVLVWSPVLLLLVVLPATAVIYFVIPLFLRWEPDPPSTAGPRHPGSRRDSALRKLRLADRAMVWFGLLTAGYYGWYVVMRAAGLGWTLVWWAGLLILWLGLAYLDGPVMRQTETTGMLPLPSARYVLALRATTACMLMVLLATFCLLISTRLHALESREAEKVYTALMNPAPSDLPALPQELLDAARIFPD